MIRLFSLLLISIFCSSCATFEMYDYLITGTEVSVNYAYKFNDKKESKISLGMVKDEVKRLWGEPLYTSDSSLKSYDQQWCYTKILSEKDGIYRRGKAVDFYLYFKGNTLKRITESYYHRQ